MSFILDALKKSENERQRQHGPTLVDVPVGKRKSAQPWWAIGVGLLLLANLGVLVVVFLRHGDSTAARVMNEPVPAVAPSPAPVIAAPSRPAAPPVSSTPAQRPTSRMQAGVRSLADEATPPEVEYDTVPAAAAETLPAGPPLVRPANGANAAAPALSSAANENIPTINDVGGAGAAGLAELHLDVHVYSQQSNARFVFINTRKYVEGQTLTEGPMVERITPEGVILNHHGRRFLLPRQ